MVHPPRTTPPGRPAPADDGQLQAQVDQLVLLPLQTNSLGAHSARHYHPVIQGAYGTLIQILAGRLNDLAPLDVVADSFQRLKDLSQSAGERPRTPTRSTSASAAISPDTPRSIEAKSKARSLATKLGDSWIILRRQCRTVSDDLHSGSQHLLADSLDTFLRALNREKQVLVPHFKRLSPFAYDDASQLETARTAVQDTIAHINQRRAYLTDDQQLYYLLSSLDFAAPEAPSDPMEQPLYDRLAEGLRRPFKGDAEHRFAAFTAQVNRSLFLDKPQDQRPYYKGTVIVQSSGTGKTRMVLELGRTAPLLYVCIRPSDTTSARSGYPLGDKPIMKLTKEKICPTDDERAAVLLAAWFDTLAVNLEHCNLPADKFAYLVRLNDFGDREHESQRRVFFEAVARKARSFALDASIVAGSDPDVIFQYHLDAPVQRLSRQISLMQRDSSRQPRTASAASTASTAEPMVYVAIDECVTFAPDFLDSICRAWAYIGELEHQQRQQALRSQHSAKPAQRDHPEPASIVCFWLVLLSTNSTATALVRPQAEHSSTRHQAAVPLPTFVGVGFDVLRSELPYLATAGNVDDPTYIQKYGRPLWISLISHTFWHTAVHKLLGTAPFFPGDRNICFNVLGSRLALQYVPTRSADSVSFGEQASFARQAVDRHMRILEEVDQDAVLHIASPSEPVLAIAAALAMMPTPNQIAHEASLPNQKALNRYGSILETVHTMCLVSAQVDILKGVRGELLTRLLFMTAWDANKMQSQEYQSSEDQTWKARHLLQPVRLESILDGIVMLEPSNHARVFSRIDKVCDQVRVRHPTYSNVHAWTHFTHFDQLKIMVQELSPEYLWYCWKRGVAIQMAHGQHGIDGIIPVFVGDLSQPLGDGEKRAADHMTFVAWESKNRTQAGPKKADESADKVAHAGPRLQHEQGTPRASLTERGLLTVLSDLDIKDQPPRVRGIANTDSLQVWIRGLGGSNNYPCLDTLQIREVVVDFHRTIASRPDFDSHNCIPDPMDLESTRHIDEQGQGNVARAATASLDQMDQMDEDEA
ncbi:uncharacterized protein SPSC_06351 [Sporisorium scitamineum]|uniref:Uncharacterized protein n=1 Tax=Sporisorium scitamineum TaxID=49012 RepID=A0A0F7S9N3_9BASI|nr:uncharacterized protein SPSC_06351 [Sporisorium scitamineum]CDW99702.1 hypothetical protein [Sporisorium scitamineum]